MGHNLKVVGQVGRPCSSYASSYSKEMAHHGFPVFLAMEVAQKRRATSDFQGNAECDLPSQQGEYAMERLKDQGYTDSSQLRPTMRLHNR
mgnify:CR=1 FL=1